MGICIPSGTADATGEKTRFQAKNRFFHSGVSLFHSGGAHVLALKMRNNAAWRTPHAFGSPCADRFEQRKMPRGKHEAEPGRCARRWRAGPGRLLTQRKRYRHQHRARARHFAGESRSAPGFFVSSGRPARRDRAVAIEQVNCKITNLRFVSCDLCVAQEEDASGAFRVLSPLFRGFGAGSGFCGPVATLRCPDDSSRLRGAANFPVKGPCCDRVSGNVAGRRAVGSGDWLRADENGIGVSAIPSL